MTSALLDPYRFHPVRVLGSVLGLGLIAYAASDHPFYGGPSGFGATQAGIMALGLALATISFVATFGVAKKVILVASLLLLLLAAVEAILSASMGTFLRKPFRHDDALLFTLRPGIESEHPSAGGSGRVSHRVNNQGFRGPEILDKRASKRIFVYGDAYIHAPYSPHEDTFAHRLEVGLGGATKVEVRNGGVSFYGPDQVAVRLEEDLPAFQPDAVIVAISSDDYNDLVNHRIFRVGARGGLEIEAHAVTDEAKAILDGFATRSPLVLAIESLLTEGSFEKYRGNRAAPEDVIPAWLKASRALFEDAVVTRNRFVSDPLASPYAADLSLEPDSRSARYKAELMQLVLARIAALCAEHQTRLLILWIPHPVDVFQSYPYALVDRAVFKNYASENLSAPIADAAKRAGVPYLDLTPVFERTKDRDLLYQNNGSGFWSAEGQAVAADAVATFFSKKELLTRKTASSTTVSATPKTRDSARVFFFAHSMADHARPNTQIGTLMCDIARAAGDECCADGTWTKSPTFDPNALSTYPFPPDRRHSHKPPCWEGSFEKSTYDVMVTTEVNFHWPTRDPRRIYPRDGLALIHKARAVHPKLDVYFMEHWPPFEDFGVEEWKTVHYRSYHRWFTDIQDEMNGRDPKAQVRLVPAGWVFAQLLQKGGPLSTMAYDDLFIDRDPHGTGTTYFVIALVHYMSIYGKRPPSTYVPPEFVHPTLRRRFGEAVDIAWAELVRMRDAAGNSRLGWPRQ